MKIAQIIDVPVDQVVTRADHNPDALAGLGQAASAAVMPPSLTKEQIKRVQQELIRIGYPLQGGADGLRGRTTNKAIEIAKSKLVAAGIVNATDMVLLRELDAGNRKLIPSQDEKAAVKALWTGSSTSGGSIVGSGGSTTAGGSASSENVKDPFATDEGIMQKYESWLKSQAWIPAPLQNPYVAAGAVTVVGGLLIYGIYRVTRSSPAAAPAVAGVDELGAMRSGYEPPKRRKKRKSKSRKAKK